MMDPIRIDDPPGDDAKANPKIVALSDGDFIVLYDKNRGEAGVLGRRFKAKGEEVSDEFRVFSGSIGNISSEARRTIGSRYPSRCAGRPRPRS